MVTAVGIPWYHSALMVYLFDTALVLLIVIYLLLALFEAPRSAAEPSPAASVDGRRKV